jgi:heme-degrading monooxygenase HmoA
MILELAMLNVRSGHGTAFEAAFAQAKLLIASMPGFVSLDLQKNMKAQDRYVLLVRWRHLEDHTEGFRKSPEYLEWSRLLHHFYEPFPTVEYYRDV